jgi:uncharacterized protein YbjT (DUF2867 family)
MILVVGGTGRLGGKIVELLRHTAPVRVMTRDPKRTRGDRDGVEVVHGDLHDHGSLDRALRGATALVCTANGGEGSGATGPGQIDGAGVARLIDAASHRSLRQFVYVSSASARPDSPVEFFRLKAAAEQRLGASGIPYAIIRPTHLMETWARVLGQPLAQRSRAMVLGSGRNPVSFVAADDVARAAAHLADQDGEGYHIDLGGPQALTIIEFNELIAATFELTVRRQTRLSAGMLRLASRILRPFNEITSRQLSFGALLDTQPQVVDSTPAWQRLGIRPTTLHEWLRHNATTLAAEWRLPAGQARPAARSS